MIKTNNSIVGHISTNNKLNGRVSNKNVLRGKVNNATVEVYPELENLEVTPSIEEQNFKSELYGYDNVKIKAIPEEYMKASVVEKTLVLSRGNVEEGVVILWMK